MPRQKSNQTPTSVETAYLGRGWSFPPRWEGMVPESQSKMLSKAPAQEDSRDSWVRMQKNQLHLGHPDDVTAHDEAKASPNRHYQIEMSESLDDICEAIYIILGTRRGERVMHPEFGSNLHQYVFDLINPRTLNLIATEIKETLTLWERRIRDIDVNAKPSEFHEGQIDAEISFTVETHRMRQSFIYPFYVNHPESR